MIIVMKLSGSWKPRAAERMRPMAALFDSEIPLVSFHSIVASMDALSWRIVRASFTNGSSRDRDA
jgi:hypothetical protein